MVFNQAKIDFDIGDHVGEMHGHEPSDRVSREKLVGYTVKSIFEISEQQATSMVGYSEGDTYSIVAADRVTRENKQAFVVSVAANDDLLVVYSYDFRFYLTTLGK